MPERSGIARGMGRSNGFLADGLDWQNLAGRFAAVHAFYATAVAPPPAQPTSLGSFDPAIARLLASYAFAAKAQMPAGALAGDTDEPIWEPISQGKRLHRVNPIISADGKSAAGIGSGVAGPTRPALEG